MNIRSEIALYIRDSIRLSVQDSDDIFELGVVDSLFGLQLVTFVEQHFKIEVNGDDLDIANFCSIDALTTFVERKV